MTAEVAGTVTAPPAPGQLGQPLEPTAALAYLDALGRWVDARRAELDLLDRAALAATDPAVLTGDVTLSMALWQAVADRYALLRSTWDSGRLGPTERARLSALVWGRVDAAPLPALGTTTAVTLPEACRLSDALVGQLRERLGLDPSGAAASARVATLRAQLERVREQVGLEPAGPLHSRAADRTSGLARRLADVALKAGRGGDVTGLLGPLEIEAATFERDLIVAAAQRREAGARLGRVRDLRAGLEAREQALRTLARTCVETVRPAPRYAVPDVGALGPLPSTTGALAAYAGRLTQVERALGLAEQAYAGALRAHADRDVRLQALHLKAAATGRADLDDAYAQTRAALDARPSDAALAARLLDAYAAALEQP